MHLKVIVCIVVGKSHRQPSLNVGTGSSKQLVNDQRLCERDPCLLHNQVGMLQFDEWFGDFNLSNVPTEAHILKSPTICAYCSAKKFENESKGFCCCDGKVRLQNNSVPNELYNLFTSNEHDALHFKNNECNYNNHFAFTSFGVKCDKELHKNYKGIYTFRVQGQVYHYINELLPNDNCPSYLQLYFYDTENELHHRLQKSDKFSESILRKLIHILKINPYSKFFRSLSNIDDLKTYKIHIRCDPGLDQRVYNTPSASQVAAIWIDDDPSADIRVRDISICYHSGVSHRIHYYFGCYDPLQYPLLFPYGEPGWHEGIEKIYKEKVHQCHTVDNSIDLNTIHSANELIDRENTG